MMHDKLIIDREQDAGLTNEHDSEYKSLYCIFLQSDRRSFLAVFLLKPVSDMQRLPTVHI